MAYGWIIDVDHLADGHTNERGVMGPRGIAPAVESALRAGHGVPFQMRDDDGELYYSGRIIDAPTVAAGVQPATLSTLQHVDGFEPLDDFGRGNAGCTSIEYRGGPLGTGAWEVL
jgi:hypothetical protein